MVIELIVKREDENKVQNMIDVISIRNRFDFEEYASVEKYEKKKILLNILQDGILTLAKLEGWPTEPLVDAYNCCLKKNIENNWLREDKYFLSPGKKYYAGIFCNWDIDKFEAFAIFLNKQKEEIKRVKLFEKEPWNVDPMRKMRWDRETGEFYLYSKDNKHKWAAKLN